MAINVGVEEVLVFIPRSEVSLASSLSLSTSSRSLGVISKTPRPQGKREINKEMIYTERDTSRYTVVASGQNEPDYLLDFSP